MNLISVLILPILFILSIQDQPCFRFQFSGSRGVRNPCQGYTCPFNAWCMPSDDLTSPKCVCHQTCYDVGDSDDSFPVCGSNGINYKNLCHLKREACSLKVDITVRYWGRCGMTFFKITNKNFSQQIHVILSIAPWILSVG